MRNALLLTTLLTLAACGSTNHVPPVATLPAGVVAADMERPNAQRERPVLSNEVLPSLSNNVAIRAETPLMQRPKTGSVILRTLAAGSTVQLLGGLDNADGQWRSVSLDDIQGWVRAEQISP